MQKICKEWKVTDEEYFQLEEQFGKLCQKQAWILLGKNYRNNHTEDQVDIAQEMRLAMIRAGSYYKRQIYIEKCLELCLFYAKDDFVKSVVDNLQDLWNNKTRHGANRQKFGPHQEEILTKLVKKLVPKRDRPDKQAPLKIDQHFITYCKAITWNAQKSLGKKITREKVLRSNQVSISEFDYLSSTY